MYGSWFGLVDAEGDLNPAQRRAFEAGRAFLEALETTQLTKSYKPLVLLAMLNRDRLPGEIPLAELMEEFRAIAERNATLREDVGTALSKDREFAKLLEQNPIDAWVGGRGTGGIPYFSYEGKTFRFLPAIPEDVRSEFQELVRELCDWRLAQYQLRTVDEQARAGSFRAKVSHAGKRPILFLPDRDKTPGLPEGWVHLNVDGRPYEGNFVKVALNVVRRPDSEDNELPSILRGWFGHDAGLPGTNHWVACEPDGDGYRIEPVQPARKRKR